MSHDTASLWGLLSRELDDGDARRIQVHLGECPDCRGELALIRSARSLAGAAAVALPAVEWTEVDRALEAFLEGRTRQSAGLDSSRWSFAIPVGLLLLAVVAVGAKWLPSTALASPGRGVQLAMVPSNPAEPEGAKVIKAVNAVRAKDGRPLIDGASVVAGESIRVGRGGKALLVLPEGSRLRVGGESQLKLERATTEDIGLNLLAGRVAIQGSREPRNSFEVRHGQFVARVMSTTLGMAVVKGGVEVAVNEGRVHVERPNALPTIVAEGKRILFPTATNRTTTLALSAENKAEFAEVYAAPVKRETAVAAAEPKPQEEEEQEAPRTVRVRDEGLRRAELPAIDPRWAPDELPPGPRMAETEFTPFPKSSPTRVSAAPEAAPFTPVSSADDWAAAPRAQPVKVASAAPMPLVIPPLAQPVAEEPAPVAVTPVPTRSAPRPAPVPVPANAKLASKQPAIALPAEPTPEPKAAPVAATPPPALATPAEASAPVAATDESGSESTDLFLLRAERAVKRGGCQRYLVGLEEIASDTPATEQTERARITRARCFDATGRGVQAKAEYQRYLRETPHGDFAQEAQRRAGP